MKLCTNKVNYFKILYFIILCMRALFSGRSLPYEVQNHVRPNFATPILYAKNHSKFHNFFCKAMKSSELYLTKI
jgi:hypothetical protein